MPRVIKRKNRKTTQWEKDHSACKTCGAMFPNEHSLRIHKGRFKHWTTAPNKDLVIEVEAKFEANRQALNAPESPSIVEIVDTSIKTEIVEDSPKTREIENSEIVSDSVDLSDFAKVEKVEKIENVTTRIPLLIDENGQVNQSQIKSDSDANRFIDPFKCNITQINPGSILLLYAHVFTRKGNRFTPFYLKDPIEGVVSNRWIDSGGEYYLDVDTEQGSYSCNEKLVLPKLGEPQIKIVQYGRERVLFTKKPIGTDTESLNFHAAVCEYFNAFTALKTAQDKVKKLEESVQPTIKHYVNNYGMPSADNAKDALIKDAGYRIHYTYKELSDCLHLKKEQIIEFLVSKNLAHLLKSEYVLNDEIWEGIKDFNILSEEEINQLEYLEKLEPERSIIIEKIEKGTS